MSLSKLIITATIANSWIYPEIKNWAESPEDIIKDAVACYEAGASIAHVHLPRNDMQAKQIVDGIRDQCDVIIQAGMSSFPIQQRKSDFDAKPDMLSIIACHHAEQFPEGSVNVLHGIEELEDYCIQCRETNIKPEWEIWHNGCYWNLNLLINKGVLSEPYILTQFFNWPGGTWSPATPQEFYHRLRYVPENSRITVSTMGNLEQLQIATLAILNGDNIRVGTEDNPFMPDGTPAKNNAEIISYWVKKAKDLGREVADPSEARTILNM